MIRFRVILRFALFGQRATSLAQLYYRYTHFMNEPPHVEIRCLDAMEYVWRPYYVDLLRRTHVFEHGDIDPKVAKQVGLLAIDEGSYVTLLVWHLLLCCSASSTRGSQKGTFDTQR